MANSRRRGNGSFGSLSLLLLLPSASSLPNNLIFGNDVTEAIQKRVADWWSLAPSLPDGLSNSTTFVIGNQADSAMLISDDEVAALPSEEGFIVRSSSDGSVVAVRGGSERGNSYGSYCLLELVGVRFMHPLSPTVLEHSSFSIKSGINVTETPHWPLRGWHYHTQHPLELTEVFNGFAAVDSPAVGQNETWDSMVPQVDLFFQWCIANRLNFVEWLLLYEESWADFAASELRKSRLRQLTDLAHNLTLLASADVPIALRQQHSWFMIKNTEEDDWAAQIDARLEWLFEGAGFDFLGTESGSTEFTHADCDTMLAWINHTALSTARNFTGKRTFIKCHCSDAGTCPEFGDLDFNFLPKLAVTEMGVASHTIQTFAFDDPTSGSYGNSNFTKMLNFSVEVAATQPNRLNLYYGETAYWVNFDINVPLFLPVFGDRRVHDLRLLRRAEADGALAAGHAEEGVEGDAVSFDGQMNFCSGWEWGYWMQEVITARGSWSVPFDETEPDESVAHEAAMREALKPIASTLADGVAIEESLSSAGRAKTGAEDAITDFLVRYMAEQRKLLIYGSSDDGDSNTDIDSAAPRRNDDDTYGPTYKRNGHAYMEGWEAMSDVEFAANALNVAGANTQPAHLSLRSLMNGGGGDEAQVSYERQVRPLLRKVRDFHAAGVLEWTSIIGVNASSRSNTSAVAGRLARNLLDELSDALRVTSLRAEQVFASYEAAHVFHQLSSLDDAKSNPVGDKKRGNATALQQLYTEQLAAARSAIEAASDIVKQREGAYRVPGARITGWRWNPTAYDFGYLWTASSLLYWWRDYGIVARSSPESRSPCYLNFNSPEDIAVGSTPRIQAALQAIREREHGHPPMDWVTDCLSAPKEAWVFPEDL